MNGQDLTHGNVRKQLWSLAWPMMLSVFFYTLYNLVDAFWVSKISPEAIAAVSISQITLFVMISLGFGITIGSGVIMAMNIGSKNKAEAERVLGQSFVLAVLAGIFFTVLSLIFKNQLLVLSGANGEIFAPALEYFTITAGGSVLFFILITIMFAFNSQGDTFTLTKLFALSTVVNLVMDPVLIFGRYGFPKMGISGAAVSTLISQIIFIIVALRSLSNEKRMIRFYFKNLSFRWKSVKKVLAIGIPASLTQVINPLGTAALMLVISSGFQEPGTVAFSLGFRIEFFAFLPAVGFGFGAMSLMGQNIGAGNIARAREAFKLAFLYGVCAASALGIIAAIFAGPIIGAFTTDRAVTQSAITYFWIVTLSYGFLSAMMVEANAFQAIGRSWPGFWIFFVRFAVVSVPLSYALTLFYNLPIVAVWGSIAAGNIISAIFGYFWIHKTLRNIKMKEVPVHR